MRFRHKVSHSLQTPMLASLCLLATLAMPTTASAQSCDCAQSSLVGSTVNTLLNNATQFAVNSVVGPGVELPTAGVAPNNLGSAGNSPRWKIDFGANTIRVDFITQVATYGAGSKFTFSSLDPKPPAGCPGTPYVSGMTATTNKTSAPYVNTGTFGPHQVVVPFAPTNANVDWNPGEYILVTLKFACDTASLPPQTLANCEKEGQPVTLDVSTGIGAIGSKDQHWTVSGGGTAPAAYSTNKVAPWVTPSGTSQWIQPATGGTASSNFPPNTTYTYTTKFVVSPLMAILGGVTVQGTYSADNSAVVKLNGQQVASCTIATCFQTAHPFTATNIVAGLNTLEIVVTNNEGYTGALVNASVVSKCVSCK
jgi:hypothetical protein